MLWKAGDVMDDRSAATGRLAASISSTAQAGRREGVMDALLHRAETEPINVDISAFSDEWREGFLAGQNSILEEIQAGRLVLPDA